MQTVKTIVVVGGTGFVGRYVVRLLVLAGFRVKVIARYTADAENSGLKTSGYVGQVAYIQGDLARVETIVPHLVGAYAVINLVGILFESGKRQQFTKLHSQGAEKLAQAAKAAGVECYVHMSALGVDRASQSTYASTKLLGEKAVQAAFPTATIIRPSVIFGAEDNFFNQFAAMAMVSPILPLIGGGTTCFQPVFIEDVAKTIVEAILQPKRAQGRIFELGGPRSMSFKQVLETVLELTGRNACLWNIPFPVANFISVFAQLAPKPALTRDQVRLLHYDNVVSGSLPSMEALGITPTSIESVVPHYLKRYRKGGK